MSGEPLGLGRGEDPPVRVGAAFPAALGWRVANDVRGGGPSPEQSASSLAGALCTVGTLDVRVGFTIASLPEFMLSLSGPHPKTDLLASPAAISSSTAHMNRPLRPSSSMEPPALRKVTANVLTQLGWLHGRFILPPHQSLVDFLAPGVHVIKFTRVQLPQSGEAIPFVALRRESVALMEPTLGNEMVETVGSIGRTSPRDVTCLLPTGQVRGTLEVLVNVRVSDFLRQEAGMIGLRQCIFAPYGERDDSPKTRRLATVLVNLSSAVGVAKRGLPQ